MVDFRYHLVSLVLVFMALAIGVILGADPLQSSIGTTPSSQVEPLRKSRDKAGTEVDTANNALPENEKQLGSAGAQLVGGTLKDRRVAIVVLPGVENFDLKAAKGKVSKAGATVAGMVTLVDSYVAASANPYRNTLVCLLVQYVDEKSDADPHAVVASGVGRLLFMGSSDPNMIMIRDALTAKDNQMIQIQGDVEGGVQVIVMVTPKKMEIDKSAATPAAEAKSVSNGYVEMVKTLSSKGPTATVGKGTSPTSLLAKVCEAKGAGSTADLLDTVAERTNVAIVVASETKGPHVHLGQGDGAQAAIGTRVDVPATPTQAPKSTSGPASEEG